MAFEMENELKRWADRLEISLNFLAALARVSTTKLSTAFNNARRLSHEDAKTLQTTLRELESLVEACKPLQLRFSNPEACRGWLEAKRNGELFVIVGTTHEEAVTEAAGGAALASREADGGKSNG